MRQDDAKKPVIYTCAGCSYAGQVANQLGCGLDRKAVGKLSCLAGIATGRKKFVREIRNKPVWVIDGCTMQCASTLLRMNKIDIDEHINLWEWGVKKHKVPDTKQVNDLIRQITALIEEAHEKQDV